MESGATDEKNGDKPSRIESCEESSVHQPELYGGECTGDNQRWQLRGPVIGKKQPVARSFAGDLKRHHECSACSREPDDRLNVCRSAHTKIRMCFSIVFKGGTFQRWEFGTMWA